jgi:hypothetical protein
VRYLPSVRDETLSQPLHTPASVGLAHFLGANRAAAFHDTLQINVRVILQTTLHQVLTERMHNNLSLCSDALRDAFAKEASICEDDRELKDMARCYFDLTQRQEKGSTQALTTSPSGVPAQIFLPPLSCSPHCVSTCASHGVSPSLAHSGERKRKLLEWWSGTADVVRRDPNGTNKLQADLLRLTFHPEDASLANTAMLKLVDELLMPLLATTPATLRDFWSGSKKDGKKRAKKAGGLDNKNATHYERLLAVVHLINLLDVWRRNSSEFLCTDEEFDSNWSRNNTTAPQASRGGGAIQRAVWVTTLLQQALVVWKHPQPSPPLSPPPSPPPSPSL